MAVTVGHVEKEIMNCVSTQHSISGSADMEQEWTYEHLLFGPKMAFRHLSVSSVRVMCHHLSHKHGSDEDVTSQLTAE